jgi:hypothetical protein
LTCSLRQREHHGESRPPLRSPFGPMLCMVHEGTCSHRSKQQRFTTCSACCDALGCTVMRALDAPVGPCCAALTPCFVVARGGAALACCCCCTRALCAHMLHCCCAADC